MTSSRSYILCITIIVQTCTIICGDVIKSSLTFVIDDTGSMWNEINQVKDGVNAIFDSVTRSNTSQIENFILVTFNDPDAEKRIVTNDREEFKEALARIHVGGGGLCPEYSMLGIELAIEHSLPGSYLYVFTDASAEDYKRWEHVKGLALKKQIQVNFLLTGDCGSESSVNYQVYHKLARATSGMVFNLMKTDIQDILRYIEETITNKADVVASKILPPGYGHEVPYYVDSCIGPTLISATGIEPRIETVTGPGGTKLKKDDLIKLHRVAISKITCAKPGNHTAKIGSKSETNTKISAKTSFDFKLGFSAFKPSSIIDTATRPPPTGHAFLSVKLIGDGVKFNAAKIIDTKGNVITELPLQLIDEKENFYISPSFYPTPMFSVSISGSYANGAPITRHSPTAIERQPIPTAAEIKKMKPQVKIEEGPTILTEYNSPLQLHCKVQGYPKPEITWVDKNTGIELPAKVLEIELPYDFVSILDLEKAKNATYVCKANNAYGEIKEQVEVEAEIYFDVIEIPKDPIRIEYNKNGKIVCKVDAHPPATITWFKDIRMITGDGNYEISSNGTSLTIKHMKPELEGKFMCEARNVFERKLFHFNVLIFGLKAPVIDKRDKEINAKIGTNAELSCRVTQGIPKPTLRWYFQRKNAEKFKEMEDTNEVIHLKNVRADQAGLYKCIADNVKGSDNFTVKLQVEYKPTIKPDQKRMKLRVGDVTTIKCDVDGVPTPTVQWYRNGERLKNTTKLSIFSDHSLGFIATLADNGDYVCVAANKHGSAKKNFDVIVFVPVSITAPKVKHIEKMVGNNVMLPCKADGNPVPKIKWIFHSSDPKIPSKDIMSPMNSSSTLNLRMVQLNHQGNYTCVASNKISGSANVTYELFVNASPIIENDEGINKIYEAVEGDLVLRIKCKATGNPKPSIIWRKDDMDLAYGSQYDLEENTLIVKKIDSLSQGTYICVARNKVGNDTAAYEVIFADHPEEKRPTSTVFVEEGHPLDLQCNVSHKNTDSVRWFKNGKRIGVGRLHLPKITRGQDGLYTCRVSDLSRSHSVTTKVVIQWKPKFYYDDVINTFEFAEDNIVELNCFAEGAPEPEVTWKHNGVEIDIKDMNYILEMTLSKTGTFTCEVSNKIGTIQRSFNIVSRDCILDITKDFPEKQPLMLSKSLKWPKFEMAYGHMVIPKGHNFYLNCPTRFLNFPKKMVMAYCEGGSNIKINGNVYKLADMQCNSEATPETLPTGAKCSPGNTESFDVGYKLMNHFLKAYEVCFDKDRKATLFTKHSMTPYHADTPRKSKWFSSNLLPVEFDTMYNCDNQVYDVSSSLRRKLTSDSCCFTKRQLVNAQDLRPGVPAAASFYSLNVAPHWSTCNTKNWEEVEKRTRSFVEEAGRDMIISTGTKVHGPPAIKLSNGLGGHQTVPQYLWKVVQDPVSASSLAIIQVNIPELSPAQAEDHVLCRDICSLIDWMQNPNWTNVADGFTYCCSITDFEKAFGFKGVFSPGMTHVLFDAYQFHYVSH